MNNGPARLDRVVPEEDNVFQLFKIISVKIKVFLEYIALFFGLLFSNVSPFIKFVTRKLEAWILSHASLFLALLFVVLMFLFVALAYAFVGVSATESGNLYNHLQDVI